MSISTKIRRTTLAEVLELVEKIINKPVRRDGSPAKHIQIRDAVKKMMEDT